MDRQFLADLINFDTYCLVNRAVYLIPSTRFILNTLILLLVNLDRTLNSRWTDFMMQTRLQLSIFFLHVENLSLSAGINTETQQMSMHKTPNQPSVSHSAILTLTTQPKPS